jgi:hypothetical protein
LRFRVLSFGGSVALALLTFSAAAPQATAGTIYNNLAQTSDGADQVVDFGPLADSFSTGADAVSPTDLQLLLTVIDPTDGGTFAIELLPDAGITPDFGAPLEVIAGIADSSLTVSPAVYDYVFSTPVALAANTRYWIGLDDPTNGSSAVWFWAPENDGNSSEYLSNQSGVFPNSGEPYQMQLNVNLISAAPEPASWSLMIVFGVGPFVFMARRRKRG